MLQITIPETEEWDEQNECFITTKETKLILEHSLISVSKWESKWKKPYLDDRTPKTQEESLDYIKCMCINTNNIPDDVYMCITADIFETIKKYIDDPMTATTIYSNKKQTGPKRIVTSELIYYWMISFGVPVEFEKWHLNRLLMLLNVCSEEQNAGANTNKMSTNDILARNMALNAKRRAALHTKG